MGIMTVVSAIHSSNALFPIDVTESGSRIDVSAEQPLNVLSPIIVIALEIVIVVNEILRNAESPIVMRLEPNVTVAKLVAFVNALSPIVVTASGIAIVVTDVQPLKALCPILVIVLPIVTLVKLVLPTHEFAAIAPA